MIEKIFYPDAELSYDSDFAHLLERTLRTPHEIAMEEAKKYDKNAIHLMRPCTDYEICTSFPQRRNYNKIGKISEKLYGINFTSPMHTSSSVRTDMPSCDGEYVTAGTERAPLHREVYFYELSDEMDMRRILEHYEISIPENDWARDLIMEKIYSYDIFKRRGMERNFSLACEEIYQPKRYAEMIAFPDGERRTYHMVPEKNTKIGHMGIGDSHRCFRTIDFSKNEIEKYPKVGFDTEPSIMERVVGLLN